MRLTSLKALHPWYPSRIQADLDVSAGSHLHSLNCPALNCPAPPQTCVVVTTGASCVLHMHPPPGRGLQPKEVLLPRRSICVLSEDARWGRLVLHCVAGSACACT